MQQKNAGTRCEFDDTRFLFVWFLGGRQVAVLIAQGDTAGAVKALNGYLSEFAADAEAWLQLAKLHVGALNYEVRLRRRTPPRPCDPEFSQCVLRVI